MTKKMIAVSLGLVFMCSAFLILAGCAKKTVPVAPSVETDSGRAHTGATSDVDPEAVRSARLEDLDAAAAKKEDADQAAISAMKIYFDYDRSDLNENARNVLNQIAAILKTNPSYSLDISGHCDERGTIEYNLALGERRARSAKKFLVALGIAGDRVSTISYGEEKPVDPRSNEAAWAQNRRDEFLLVK